jgi:hypothetical protein
VAVQAPGVPLGLPGIVEQFQRQGGDIAGPGGVGTPGALQGPGLAGVEESEPHGEGDGQADADLGGDPAQVAHGDGAMKEETEEVADEQQYPADEAPRAETPEVGADGQDDRE